MRSSLIFKINFLVLGLALTVYISYQLRARGLGTDVLALFGINAPAATSRSSAPNTTDRATEKKATDDESAFRWNWCQTRVTAMIKPEEFKIAQEGNLWVYEAAAKQVVNFLSVEKWLAKFCTVDAKKLPNTNAERAELFKPALMVKFVDGHVELIRRSTDGQYLWRGQAFTSPEFDSALSELSTLPEAKTSK